MIIAPQVVHFSFFPSVHFLLLFLMSYNVNFAFEYFEGKGLENFRM